MLELSNFNGNFPTSLWIFQHETLKILNFSNSTFQLHPSEWARKSELREHTK